MTTEGTTIGQYRIVRKIGEGGMGAVYLAQHALLGRNAAIKVLLPALSSQREVVERFFNEARATTAITDPGIVQVFDFGFHTDGSAYIVMELLEGESLEARLQRGPIAVVDALKVTRQVASSLAAAHAKGIVHRDLKPDNLFIVRDAEAQGGERPKILDFGIAKLTSDAPDRSRTRTGTLLGTPIYMSPEQCRGSGLVDHRSDIYSLGCVAYHLICGRPPFDFEGIGEIISAHLREAPVPPSQFGAPIAVDEIVLRCLEKQPDQRYQSMIELRGACEAMLARISGAGAMTLAMLPSAQHATTPTPTTLGAATGQASTTAATPPRSRMRLALAIAVLGIALGAGGLVVAHRSDTIATTPAAAPVSADAAIAVVVPPTDAAMPIDAPPPPLDAPPPPPPPPIDAPIAVPIDAPSPHHHAPPPPPHRAPTQGADPYDVR